MDEKRNSEEQPLRFEFRIFGQDFVRETEEIHRHSLCTGTEETQDIYLVTAANTGNNVKIRDQNLDIKVFMGVEQGLELWKPSIKRHFPISGPDGLTDLFKALAVKVPAQHPAKIDIQNLMTRIIWPHPEILVAKVYKLRSHFQIGNCRVETDKLLVNGAAIQSISLECADVSEVLRVKRLLTMQQHPNVNYLLALKRILGMVPFKRQTF